MIKNGILMELDIRRIIAGRNARTTRRTDAGMRELSKSIKMTGGLLVPIIVQLVASNVSIKDDRYELIAGHRRLEACKMLKAQVISAIVVKLSQNERGVANVVENLQRQDLTPLEEAKNIQRMMKAMVRTSDETASLDTVAAALGKDRVWVRRRAQLSRLTPKWVDAFKLARHNDMDLNGWGAVHMEFIARYDAKQQDDILEHMYENYRHRLDHITIKDLEAVLANLTHRMSGTPWDKNDATLNPKVGACIDCPKRSSAMGDLFDQDVSKKQTLDRCLDFICWADKMHRLIARKVEANTVEGKAPMLLKVYGYNPERDEKYPDAVRTDDVLTCKKSDKGAKPAIVIDGPGIGRVRYVKEGTRSSIAPKSTSNKLPTNPGALQRERVCRLNGRRAAWTIRKLIEIIEDGAGYKTPPSFMEKKGVEHLCTYLIAFGTDRRDDYQGEGAHRLHNVLAGHLHRKEPSTVIIKGVNQLWPVMRKRIGSFTDNSGATDRYKEAGIIATLFGVDFMKIIDASVQAIPTPLSWGKTSKKVKGKKDVIKKQEGAAARHGKGGKDVKKGKGSKKKKS